MRFLDYSISLEMVDDFHQVVLKILSVALSFHHIFSVTK